MSEKDYERDEIFDLAIESNRRCHALRMRLIRGEITDAEAIPEYATATAPLASAVRRIETFRAAPQEEQ